MEQSVPPWKHTLVNSNLKINNKVVHYKKWEEKGIRWLSDLLYENEDLTFRFLTYKEIEEMYNFRPKPSNISWPTACNTCTMEENIENI